MLGTRRVPWVEKAVLADSGRTGAVAAGVEWVRCLAFLSILRDRSLVMPHVRTIEVLAYQNSFLASR